MVAWMPDLTGLEGLTLGEIAKSLNQLPIIFVPIIAMLGFQLLLFIIIGFMVKVGRNKSLIEQDNYKIVFVVTLITGLIYLIIVFFPFWWEIDWKGLFS